MEAVMEKAPFGERFEDEYDDALQVDGRRNDLEVALEDQANRSLRAVRYWRSEQERLEKQVTDEVGRLQLWLEVEKRRIGDRVAWHEEGLYGFLVRSGKRSLKLAYGVLRRITGRERVEVKDEDAFLLWAEQQPDQIRAQLVKVKRSASKTDIKAYIKSTGEIPDGTDLVTGEDTFSAVTEPQP